VGRREQSTKRRKRELCLEGTTARAGTERKRSWGGNRDKNRTQQTGNVSQRIRFEKKKRISDEREGVSREKTRDASSWGSRGRIKNTGFQNGPETLGGGPARPKEGGSPGEGRDLGFLEPTTKLSGPVHPVSGSGGKKKGKDRGRYIRPRY